MRLLQTSCKQSAFRSEADSPMTSTNVRQVPQPLPLQRRHPVWSGPLKSACQRLGMACYRQQLLQLFDLPGGLVVDDPGRSVADRVVKFRYSVGNLSRDTFIFPRTTHQVMVVVVEGCEYVVTIFVGFDARSVEMICLSHHAPVHEAADRHVVERAFSIDVPVDSSCVK